VGKELKSTAIIPGEVDERQFEANFDKGTAKQISHRERRINVTTISGKKGRLQWCRRISTQSRERRKRRRREKKEKEIERKPTAPSIFSLGSLVDHFFWNCCQLAIQRLYLLVTSCSSGAL